MTLLQAIHQAIDWATLAHYDHYGVDMTLYISPQGMFYLKREMRVNSRPAVIGGVGVLEWPGLNSAVELWVVGVPYAVVEAE